MVLHNNEGCKARWTHSQIDFLLTWHSQGHILMVHWCLWKLLSSLYTPCSAAESTLKYCGNRLVFVAISRLALVKQKQKIKTIITKNSKCFTILNHFCHIDIWPTLYDISVLIIGCIPHTWLALHIGSLLILRITWW